VYLTVARHDDDRRLDDTKYYSFVEGQALLHTKLALPHFWSTFLELLDKKLIN
jgi:hypothetical protein